MKSRYSSLNTIAKLGCDGWATSLATGGPNYIYLTDKGLSVCLRMNRAVEAITPDLTKGIPDADIAHLNRILLKMRENIKGMERQGRAALSRPALPLGKPGGGGDAGIE